MGKILKKLSIGYLFVALIIYIINYRSINGGYIFEFYVYAYWLITVGISILIYSLGHLICKVDKISKKY